LTLAADTAEQLMTPNPVSISASASVQEAIALLTDRGFSAAPVIDEAGRPVGVLSRSDILIHQREYTRHASLFDQTEWDVPPRRAREGFEVEVVDSTLVRDIMTPILFTVALDASCKQVVEQMLSLKVHHLFVVDEDGALVGVISSLDILRHLRIG
ncbi:MAG: CBS domain-containing protein, partial [Planctomycetes bacterium]|nr:CBS domain-containing protein [Planctomycetota bacterium]